MKTTVIVNLQVEGIHFWKDCPLREVSFLQFPHRHMFHIKAEKSVTHLDRDVEIILLKRSINFYLVKMYAGEEDHLQFGGMSCEMIAKKLLERFDLETCEVLEDGENGAKVYK
jgi:hypothetical protein